MKQQLEQIRRSAMQDLDQASNPAALEDLRVRLLGKKGELTAVLKQMGKLSAEERPLIGQLANQVRAEIEAHLEERRTALHAIALEKKLRDEALDVTIPGDAVCLGHKHPMNKALDEAKEIFISMGYTILDGPEIELAEYNFTKLNTPEGHPARDRSDTFYLTEDDSVLLRTQTSPMQIRAMEAHPASAHPHPVPPAASTGRTRSTLPTARCSTRSKAWSSTRASPWQTSRARLTPWSSSSTGRTPSSVCRPHHFPFTEPSCEVDVQCFECHGAGCRTCKGEGWIELLGAGMVHPNVLRGCGIDPEVYSGFAFGIGLERMAMRRFCISRYAPDLRKRHPVPVPVLRQREVIR